MINKREWFYLILVILSAGILMAGFTQIDLEFAQSVYHYERWMDWVLRLSMIPAVVCAWVFSMQLTAYAFIDRLLGKGPAKSPVIYMIVGFLSAIGIPVYAFWTVMRYFGMVNDSVGWVMLFVVEVFAIAGAIRLAKERERSARSRQASRAMTGLLTFYFCLLAGVVISYFRQRVSLSVMVSVGSFEYYTPWYKASESELLRQLAQDSLPLGSFPAMTVAVAGLSTISSYLLDGTHRSWRNALAVLSYLYTVFIQVLAVISGRAFPTDALAGGLLAGLCAIIGAVLFRLIRRDAFGSLYEVEKV